MRIAMLSVHTCPLATLGGKDTGGMNVYVRELARELGRRGGAVDALAAGFTKYTPSSGIPELREAEKVLSDTEGTLVGFLCPVYVEGLNVPGYHLHFLNAAKNAGGHLLDFIMTGGRVEIDATPNFYMRLPEGGDFGEIDMTQDRSQETKTVEK